jgi:TldD protein
VQARGKPYGILVRRHGFPAVRLPSRPDGSTRLVGSPVLVYKVFPDGREELVRGLRYRNLSVRTLKDIAAASDENFIFDFIGNAAPLSLIGAGGYIVNSTVVAPAVLFDDFELERPQEELPKQPIVPPPS